MRAARLVMAAGLALVAACAAATPAVAPVAPASAAPVAPAVAAAPGLAPADLERWRAIHAAKDAPPAGTTAEALWPGLLPLLDATDADVRDGLGFEIFAAWIVRDKRLGPEALRALTARLVARLEAAAPPGEDDAVFGRTFSALVLSLVAARHIAEPFFTPAEVAAQLAAARAYAGREHDLRGFVAGKGWAHAAAHTADWLKFLARDPALGAVEHAVVLDAVAALVVRPHGHLFAHGEDLRLVRPVLEVLRRGKLAPAQVTAFLDAIAAPLAQPWGGGPPMNPGLYAAQENAKHFLFTLFVVLSTNEPTGTMTPALAHLRALLQ